MKAFTLKQYFQIILIVLVFASIGYMFGFHMMFLHNAFEIFWYALYFIGGLTIMSLIAWTYESFFLEVTVIPPKKG